MTCQLIGNIANGIHKGALSVCSRDRAQQLGLLCRLAAMLFDGVGGVPDAAPQLL